MKTITSLLQVKMLRTDKEYLTYDGICIATRQLFNLIKHLESEGGTIKEFFWYQKRGSETGYFIVKAEKTVLA